MKRIHNICAIFCAILLLSGILAGALADQEATPTDLSPVEITEMRVGDLLENIGIRVNGETYLRLKAEKAGIIHLLADGKKVKADVFKENEYGRNPDHPMLSGEADPETNLLHLSWEAEKTDYLLVFSMPKGMYGMFTLRILTDADYIKMTEVPDEEESIQTEEGQEEAPVTAEPVQKEEQKQAEKPAQPEETAAEEETDPDQEMLDAGYIKVMIIRENGTNLYETPDDDAEAAGLLENGDEIWAKPTEDIWAELYQEAEEEGQEIRPLYFNLNNAVLLLGEIEYDIPIRRVTLTSTLDGVTEIEEGTEVTITAEYSGFPEDEIQEITWQYRPEGDEDGEFRDVEGAHDFVFTYQITPENAHHTWRIVLTLKP